MDTGGGAGARVSPFVDVRTAGALLQRAGFAMPVVDEAPWPVRFADAGRLLADLRGMGETGALAHRPPPAPRRAGPLPRPSPGAVGDPLLRRHPDRLEPRPLKRSNSPPLFFPLAPEGARGSFGGR